MHETKKQRVDRELIELLGELRVVLPGVQVMFGFLLVLPFQSAFASTTTVERAFYFVAILGALVANALLIAPSAYHRLRFRAGLQAKEQMLLTSNRLLIAGTGTLALTMTSVIFLITEVLFGKTVGYLIAAGAAAGFAWLWFVVPLRTPRDEDVSDDVPG